MSQVDGVPLLGAAAAVDHHVLLSSGLPTSIGQKPGAVCGGVGS